MASERVGPKLHSIYPITVFLVVLATAGANSGIAENPSHLGKPQVIELASDYRLAASTGGQTNGCAVDGSRQTEASCRIENRSPWTRGDRFEKFDPEFSNSLSKNGGTL